MCILSQSWRASSLTLFHDKTLPAPGRDAAADRRGAPGAAQATATELSEMPASSCWKRLGAAERTAAAGRH